jgi:hypothetical protein
MLWRLRFVDIAVALSREVGADTQRPTLTSDRPHHCRFVDAPFGDSELRLDCVDHQTARADVHEMHSARFAAGPRLDIVEPSVAGRREDGRGSRSE